MTKKGRAGQSRCQLRDVLIAEGLRQGWSIPAEKYYNKNLWFKGAAWLKSKKT
jgi:hypothetical protein